jgi:transmembrane sensor
MRTVDDEVEIKAAARGWLLRLSLESPTEQDRAQFAAWCGQDPRHAAAYRRFESIWQDAATLVELEPLARLPSNRDSWWRRARASLGVHKLRWAGSASLTAAMAGIGLWFLLAPTHHAAGVGPWPAFAPDYYATGIAEVRDIHLSDGSKVTLGARSSLEVVYRRNERRVTLTSGVAFFSVVKNPLRPFIVLIGNEQVRDVGTEFEIRREPTGTRIAVVEGAVEVLHVPGRANETGRESARLAQKIAAADESAGAHILTAGQQITLGLNGVIPDPQLMPSVAPAAWRYGRLVYVDTPLKDIIADANRYSHEPIEIADERAANVRVSLTYPSDRVTETMADLAHTLSLRIERRNGGVVLKARIPSG